MWSTDGGSSWDGDTFQCFEEWPHPYCSYDFSDVSVVSSQVAYVAGLKTRYDYSTSGVIFRTTDGGATFEEKAGVSWVGGRIDFPTATTGYFIGVGLNKTTDGAESWVGTNPGIGAKGLSFVDAARGWVVGTNGGIARTSDGAATWALQASGVTATLSAVDFVNPWTGTAVGAGGTILRTITGGETGAGAAERQPRPEVRLLPLLLRSGPDRV